ncbi:MAG: MFS transporter [Chloroflexota bacterium]
MNLRQFDRRLVTIILIVFVQMLGAAMILPILPLYAQNEFMLEPQWITLLNTTFFGAQFLAAPYLGRLSDRNGRVPILIVSQIGTVIAFIMLGLAPNVWILFFARLLDGITGGNFIVAQAYIADITPPEKKTVSFGYVMAAFGVGFVLGPAIGGFMAASFGPRIPYFLAAGAATIVVLLTVFTLNETVTPEIQAENRASAQKGINFRQILSQRTLIYILLIAFFVQMTLGILQSTLSLFTDAVLLPDASEERVQIGLGIIFGAVGIAQIVTQGFLIRRLLPRLGEMGLIILAGGLIISGLLLLGSATNVAVAGLSSILFAVGVGFALPSINSMATSVANESIKGQILGVVQSSSNLGVIVSSSIAGVLFSLSPRFPFYLGMVIMLVSFVPIFLLRNRLIWRKQHLTPAASDS